MPSIMDKLIETIFLSITATTTASVLALFLALMGSHTTKVNSFFGSLSRIIASVYRNIPIVAWALILLLSFGQSALTGYFALFLATFGFLTTSLYRNDRRNEQQFSGSVACNRGDLLSSGSESGHSRMFSTNDQLGALYD